MKEKAITPQIRFKGFTENWKQSKVTKIGKIYIGLVTSMTKHYTNKGTLLIRNSDIKDNRFEFDEEPIYLEESFANDNSSRMHEIGDVITVHTGDVGTSAVITKKEEKSIGFATIVTRPDTQIINSNYLCTFLNTEKHKKFAIQISTGDGRTNYNLGDYFKLNVPFPTLNEQKKIAKFINIIDNLITLHQHKYDKLINVKKILLEKMFPKKGENIPEIRFEGFTETWKECKLGEIGTTFTGLSGKSKKDFGHGKAKFVTYMNVFKNPITDTHILEPIEIDNKQNTIQMGDIFFTTSSETPEEVAMSSVCIENTENVYLNSFCFGYRPHVELNPFYMAYMLRSKSVREKFILLAQGISRYNISKTQALEIEILLPNLVEQERIGTYFYKLDNLINLHQNKLEELKKIKKSLLQKMFI